MFVSFETAFAVGLMWFSAFCLWFVASLVVRFLTWIDDGEGKLLSEEVFGTLSTLTDGNAEWKRYWTIEGAANRLFCNRFWSDTRFNQYRSADYLIEPFMFVLMFGLLGGVGVFVLTLCAGYTIAVTLFVGTAYALRCVARAKKANKANEKQ